MTHSLDSQIVAQLGRFQKAFEKDPEAFPDQLDTMWSGLAHQAVFEVEIGEDPCIVVRYHLDHRGDLISANIAATDERGREITGRTVSPEHPLWDAYRTWLEIYDANEVADVEAAAEARQEPGTIAHLELMTELGLGDEDEA